MTQGSKPLLVFDLDETLLHCQEKDFREAEYTTEFGFVAIRPGVDELLGRLQDHYDFMIWSNNGKPYIDRMLGLFWPEQHKLIDIFTSSDSTVFAKDGMGVPFYKETRKVAKRHKDYDLDRILGVDDNVGVYRKNYGNLVAIKPFVGAYDEELSHLTDFLERISAEPNLRKLEKRYWRKPKPAVALDEPQF